MTTSGAAGPDPDRPAVDHGAATPAGGDDGHLTSARVTSSEVARDASVSSVPPVGGDIPHDAVHRDPHASYAAAGAAPPADEAERAVISAQLGRPARGEPAVVHRCRWGLPTVVRVAPRLEDGTPFPTTFWLSCPALRSRVGTLEAEHAMVGCNDRLQDDPAYAAAYAAAHERYVAFRDTLPDPASGEDPQPLRGAPGSGGMPGHVKCLHVHAAHHLATGDNVVGDWTIEEATPLTCLEPCVAPPDTAPSAATDTAPSAATEADPQERP